MRHYKKNKHMFIKMIYQEKEKGLETIFQLLVL